VVRYEVDRAAFRNDKSIEIAAAPDQVFPWLAQMGLGRAGWYSWDLIDNLGRKSATKLNPEWMVRRAGDPIPGGPIGFDTLVLEPPHHLVMSFGPQRFLLWTTEFMLSYELAETSNGCRLTTVATARINGPLGGPIARFGLGPGDSFMVRKQLKGIKSRAEALPPRQ
jgi:hypothetical protein